MYIWIMDTLPKMRLFTYRMHAEAFAIRMENERKKKEICIAVYRTLTVEYYRRTPMLFSTFCFYLRAVWTVKK